MLLSVLLFFSPISNILCFPIKDENGKWLLITIHQVSLEVNCLHATDMEQVSISQSQHSVQYQDHKGELKQKDQVYRTFKLTCLVLSALVLPDKIIGVAQLCNKINGGGFNKYDEDIAQAFSVYCCISIVHVSFTVPITSSRIWSFAPLWSVALSVSVDCSQSLLYKKVRDAQHRSRVSNELMIYHMQVCGRDFTGPCCCLGIWASCQWPALFQPFCSFHSWRLPEKMWFHWHRQK